MGLPARQEPNGGDLALRARRDVFRGRRVEAWARPQGRAAAGRASNAARPAVAARSTDETRLILDAVASGLVVLIAIILAVAALSWLLPRPVEPTGATRLAPPPPSACCDGVP